MAFFSDTSSTGSGELRLIPNPQRILLHGAPWHPAPASFLHLSPDGASAIRRQAHLLAEQLEALGWRTRINTTPGLSGNRAFFTAAAALPKSAEKENGPLRGPAGKPEGYRLAVGNEGVLLAGADAAGLYYAGQTLCRLLEETDEIPGLEIEDFPLLTQRAVHLDCRGWPPTPAFLRSFIQLLSSFKINALFLEYGTHFAFQSQPEIVAPGALTAECAAELCQFARDRNVVIIPMMQTLGDVGHVLRLPAYAQYRENPAYHQQFCPTNPATFDIVTAMLEELLAAHPGTWVHLGGDEIRFLGWCMKCQEQVRRLGGRSALFLDYVGRLCRYAQMRGRKPIFWDDVFQPMNDAQLRWLPKEVILAVRHLESSGGRAAPELLVRLDHLRRLEREVWGGATLLPAEHYDGFDNMDGWTEAAELGFLEGCSASVQTRAHPQGAMYEPVEMAWPSILYAAERMWTGRKPTSRNEFAERFVVRFHGLRKKTQRDRLWSAYDLLRRGRPLDAGDMFRAFWEENPEPRNKETLLFLDAWANLAGFREYVARFDKTAADNYSLLQSGDADPFHAGRVRWRILDLKGKLPALLAAFRKQSARLTDIPGIEEFLASGIAYDLRRLDELERLYEPYPLPDKDWRRSIRL